MSEPWEQIVAALGWTRLDLARPNRHAREIAGLTAGEAREALGLPNTAGGASTFSSPEMNEQKDPPILPQLGKLLARLDAYGLEVEVLVRRRQAR